MQRYPVLWRQVWSETNYDRLSIILQTGQYFLNLNFQSV